MTTQELILEKLDRIEKRVDLIQKMIDPDTIMSEDDYRAVLAYREDRRRGRLISHEKLKKELGV